MLTEEKLQNFLDDLRLGKYDNDRYKITTTYDSLHIEDLQNDTKISITTFITAPSYFPAYNAWNDHNKIWKLFHKEPIYDNYPKQYTAVMYTFEKEVPISKQLYDSFLTYCKELQEKDRLVQRSNVESSFGL